MEMVVERAARWGGGAVVMANRVEEMVGRNREWGDVEWLLRQPFGQ